MKWTTAYILGVVLINVGFEHVPLVEIAGTMWPPMSLLVGFIFVLRDFAQREVGHGVILAMLLGAAISYVMASPYVAVASAVAFLVSEAVDWAVYTITRKPFAQRILWSSAVGTPVDSAIFLAMIGMFSPLAVVLMTASKMIGALAVAGLVHARARRHPGLV